MKTISILVDFDNYFGSEMMKINPELLEYSFSELVNLCEDNFIDFENIQIRLYGGWYNETVLTKQASTLQQLLSDVNVFPKVKNGRIIHGSVELISALHEIPDFIWYYSHKETNGIKRVRINYEAIDNFCNENRDSCPKFILYKFTEAKNKKCPVKGCNNLQKDVFKGIEQKMVDTLLVCDVLSFSEDLNINGIVLISDDQDLFPSLALAIKRQELNNIKNLQAIILCIKNEKKHDFIKNFLSPFNIQTIVMP